MTHLATLSAAPVGLGRLDTLPRARLGHLPTPIEPMGNLSDRLGLELHVKRDDCTGIGFGGNKVRQLEFYFGDALARGADTVLITGAVQSNYARIMAAMARRLGMDCHIQLEERVPHRDAAYRESGNVLLDRLLGATLHSYAHGEDETGADAELERIADGLEDSGARPYVVHLGPGHAPLGALGYVAAAREILRQLEVSGTAIDEIFVASGSGHTHAGLLFGLRALGSAIPVTGVCCRRAADLQRPRLFDRLAEIGQLLGVAPRFAADDVRLVDAVLAPGYGRTNRRVVDAVRQTAESEGLFLDPVYTGRVMAGLMAEREAGDRLRGKRVLFLHTGGQPALFAYGAQLLEDESSAPPLAA